MKQKVTSRTLDKKAVAYQLAMKRLDVAELLMVLKSLRNEASGFLGMADPLQHGHTNMRCLQERITKADILISRLETPDI